MPRLLVLALALLVGAPALAEPEWRDINPSVAQLPWPLAAAQRRPGDEAWHVLLSGNDAALVRTDGRTVQTLRWLPPGRAYRWVDAPPEQLVFTGVHDDERRFWRVEEGEVRLLRARASPQRVVLAWAPSGAITFDPDGGTVAVCCGPGFVLNVVVETLAPGADVAQVILRDGRVAVYARGGDHALIVEGPWDYLRVELAGVSGVVPFGAGWAAWDDAGGAWLWRDGLEAPLPLPGVGAGVRALYPGPGEAQLFAWTTEDTIVELVDGRAQVLLDVPPEHHVEVFRSAGALTAFTLVRARTADLFVQAAPGQPARSMGRMPGSCTLSSLAPPRAVPEPEAVWIACGSTWIRVRSDGVGPSARAQQALLPFEGRFGALGFTPHATLELETYDGAESELDLRRMRDFGAYPRFVGEDAVLGLRRFGTVLFGGLPGPLVERAEVRNVTFVSDDVVMEVDDAGRLVSRIRPSDGARLPDPGLPPDAVVIEPMAGGVLAGPERRPTHWVPPEGPAVELGGREIPPMSGLHATHGAVLVYSVLERPGLWGVDLDQGWVFALPVPGAPERLAVLGGAALSVGPRGAWLTRPGPNPAPWRITDEPARLLASDGRRAYLEVDGRRLTQVENGEATGLRGLHPSARRFEPFAGGLLFVAALDPDLGFEPYFWGGEGDPVLLGDLFEGPHGSELSWVGQEEGVAFFTAESLEGGREYGVTDGTPEGTRWLELVPGPANGAPHDFTGAVKTLADGRRAFAGLHPEHGVELAILEPPRPPPVDAGQTADAGGPVDAGGLGSGGALDGAEAGCGCRAGSPEGLGGLGVLALLALVRRRGAAGRGLRRFRTGRGARGRPRCPSRGANES